MNKGMLHMLVLAVGLLGAGCDRSNIRKIEYMPDMYRSAAVKAQEPGAVRLPPEGTVPRNYEPYHIAWEDTLSADAQLNPLPRTMEVLRVGQRYYNIYCGVCHGPQGDGDGPVAPRMTVKPPVLYSSKLRRWPDGRLFHTITLGQGNMPGYGYAITPEKRWAIVHYVRALQRAAFPTPEDLQEMEALGLSPPAQTTRTE
jgi:mono/diheme cytochrome c family protein|nr:MAG: hypothetical protein KatS3mg041_0283 [Bacteroidota bacterium]